MGKSDLRIFIGADASNLNKNIKAAQGLLIKFENVAKSVGSSIKTALVGAFAIDSALRFFSTMIEAGRGFEDQMARVRAVTNATTRDFLMMSAEAKRLGATTRYSATEAGAALENLAKNGLSTRNATKALGGVLELAGANAIGLAEAADIATNTLNMFRLEVENLNEVNDILSMAAAKSATDITELYHALSYAAPTAAQLYIELDEVSAALGVLANNGIKGERAGTAIRAVLERLINPSREAEKVLDKYGLTINETTIKVDRLKGTLEKLKAAGLSQADLGTIFGTVASGSANIMINNVGSINLLKDELANSQGAAADMFKKGTGEFQNSIDNFKSTFETALIKIFDAIKPALVPVIDGLTNLVKSLTDLRVVGTAAGAGLAGGIITGFSKLSSSVGKYKQIIDTATESLTEFSNINNSFDPKSDQFTKLKKQFEELGIKAAEAGVNLDEIHINEFTKQLNNGKVKGFVKEFRDLNKILKSSDKELDLSKILDADGASEAISIVRKLITLLLDDLASMKPATPWGTTALSSTELGQKIIKDTEKKIESLQKALDKVEAANASAEIGEFRKAVKQAGTDLTVLPKHLSGLQIAVNKTGGFFKKLGSSIIGALGGPVMATITAVTIAVGAIADGVVKWVDAEKLAKRALDDATASTSNMKEEVISTVTAMKNLDRGSTAWQMRMDHLKASYPELVDELKLAEVHLGMTEDGFNKLAEAMQNVLDKQSQMDLATAAQNARKELLEKYKTDSYGWVRDVVDFFGGRNTTPLQKFEKSLTDADDTTGGKLYASNQVDRIMLILGDVTLKQTEKISQIAEVIKTASEQKGVKYDPRLAERISDDFHNRVGDNLDSLKNYLNSKTESTTGEGTLDINKFVEGQGAIFDAVKKRIEDEAKLKFTDTGDQENYIATETQRTASLILDTILEKFRGVKIDGLDARDLLLANPTFKSIVAAAQPLKTSDKGDAGGGGRKSKTDAQYIKEAQDAYDKERKTIEKELQAGYIKEEEALQKQISALTTLMNVYRNHGNVLEPIYRNYVDDLRKLDEAVKKQLKILQDLKDAKARKEQIENRKKDYKYNLTEILGRKSGIDPFSDNLLFQEGRLEHLKGQLQDLIALRVSFTGDGFNDEVKKLDGAIITLEKHVKELDKAFTAERLKEFKKELSDLTWDVGTASYDTFVGLGEAFISVKNAMDTLSNLDEYKTLWERFVAGFQAFISITDTMLNTALGIKELAEMFKELRKQKDLYNAIESGSNVADIAGIEMEAAAVVQAEATKTAAKETAAAADIATKMLQAEAAQILMAAESTAAYAAIPFAGPALAAALIAEMKALILAAASLPAFANGGIVGGNSYIGDKVLARVNSGEMILNQKQQKNLFSMLNNGSVNGGGQVKFKIEGKELVGVLKNYNNIKGKVQ